MPSGTDSDVPDLVRRPPVDCAACHEPIVDHYFEINRTIVCEPCRHAIEAQLRGGSGFARIARAALFGGAAAIVGSAIYLAFLWFSTYDWSLVAVLIGYMVGKMVRKGGGGLGGTVCQMLAVGLTYASLGLTYFAFALLAFWQANQSARPLALGLGDFLWMLNQAFQMPVLRMRSSPISIAIIGFALWEAWKLNRPGRLVVTGPHRFNEAIRQGGAPSSPSRPAVR
jgi:hypothetical protein